MYMYFTPHGEDNTEECQGQNPYCGVHVYMYVEDMVINHIHVLVLRSVRFCCTAYIGSVVLCVRVQCIHV